MNNLKTITNHHTNVLNIYGYTEDDDRFYVVTEARKVDERCELQEAVMMMGKFSEKSAARLMKIVLEALSYCHSNNLVHGNLRPENILLGKNQDFSDVRIINFQGSLKFEGNKSLNEKFESPYFMAPEAVCGKVEEKSDGWGCGAIVYLLLTGKPPFCCGDDKDLIEKIK